MGKFQAKGYEDCINIAAELSEDDAAVCRRGHRAQPELLDACYQVYIFGVHDAQNNNELITKERKVDRFT